MPCLVGMLRSGHGYCNGASVGTFWATLIGIVQSVYNALADVVLFAWCIHAVRPVVVFFDYCIIWMSCFDNILHIANVSILFWGGSLVHDNANGINWLTDVYWNSLCEWCCKTKMHAGYDNNYLIVGCDVWCGRLVNIECDCKRNNVIAMWLQWFCRPYVLCCCDCCGFS